jgi:hypothetical protein
VFDITDARCNHEDYYYYYYYRYSALGPVWAETRVQSGDWYGSGKLHPGKILRGSLPLLSPHEDYKYNFIVACHSVLYFTALLFISPNTPDRVINPKY